VTVSSYIEFPSERILNKILDFTVVGDSCESNAMLVIFGKTPVLEDLNCPLITDL